MGLNLCAWVGEEFLQTEFMPITSLSTQIHHSKYVEVEPNSHRIVKTCVNLAEIPQIFHSLQKDVYTRKKRKCMTASMLSENVLWQQCILL